MGAGASASWGDASQNELQVALAQLSHEGRAKLQNALDEACGVEQLAPVQDAASADTPNQQTAGGAVSSTAVPQFPGNPYQDTSGTYFSDLLKRECMAVVKASYFFKCLEEGIPFTDRQNIPADYIFRGEEVLDKWERYGAMFLAIISYCWLSKTHPDPECYHLRRLVRVLKEMHQCWQEDAGQFGLAQTGEKQECGVILDFCSLWQKHGEHETRTAFQLEQFIEGLKEINTPYGHREITAIKLTSVPLSEKRTYDDRGWTLFESILIDGKAPSPNLLVGSPFGGANVLTLNFDPEADANDGSVIVAAYAGKHDIARFLASKANVDAWIAFDPFLSEVLDAEA